MLLNQLFEAITRTGKGNTAVVGWGRGMGHKGHMMLASSVITKAKEVGGDPYFVVSRTVGKDDPITPEEKLAIYKKVFPQQGHIFQAASDEIPDLTRVLSNLNQQGYSNAVVVVGADQVKAFQYLKQYNGKPDKAGNVAFNFDSLDVISRQETSDPSAGEEGPRATPMRQVLLDPSKSEEEQFAVWRDAMSPEVSDEEVRDLMNKAKERMAQFSTPKKKGKGVAEGSMSADEYKQKLLKTLPQMMGFLAKNVKGWSPSEEQMLAAVETGYIVMKKTGDVQQAGKAVMDELNALYRMSQGQKDVDEGSEFGAYYYEQLAQQTFDINPNLQDENEILNLGYKIAKGELGSRAQGMFRDEDFPSDFVSAYGYLKKQGVAEEIGYDEVSPKSASYILRKMEQGVSMSEILDDFPELGRMMEIIAGEHGLHLDDDFEQIEDILMNDLEDIAAQEDDFGDYDQDEELPEGLQNKQVPLSEGYQKKISSLIEKLAKK